MPSAHPRPAQRQRGVPAIAFDVEPVRAACGRMRPSLSLVRPWLFFPALAAAAFDLAAPAIAAQGSDVHSLLFWPSVLTAGLLFWMLVMVRGRHGLMGKWLGVEPDPSLRLPPFAKAIVAIGLAPAILCALLHATGDGAYGATLAGFAIAAAGTTQLRRDAD